MGKKTLEGKLNSPLYRYSKLAFDLLMLNIIFILVSVLSLFVLFFPSLVSLHTIINNIINDKDDENVYKTFFLEIKRQWSFSWRIEVLGMIILLIIGVIIYFDFVVIVNTKVSYIGYISLCFIIPVFLVLLSIFINLMLFNNYYKDDTFMMMIQKSALISLKKKLLTFINLIIFICFFVILFFIPYIAPFISFSFYIYIIEAINRKAFIEISNNEKERALMVENLFLPMVIEEKDK